LARLCTERTTCINTTATGGNTALMSLSEEL
jgi:delta 1-pyrroline-5-carboxylate dehydrogenase